MRTLFFAFSAADGYSFSICYRGTQRSSRLLDCKKARIFAPTKNARAVMKNEGENRLDLQPWVLIRSRFSWGARYSRPLKTDFEKKKGKGMFCNPAVDRAEEILSIVCLSLAPSPLPCRGGRNIIGREGDLPFCTSPLPAVQRSTDWDTLALP